jgi:hypothetical protein
MSFLAEKFNLYAEYANYDLIKKMGIDLFIGINNYNKTIKINNENYYQEYMKENIDYNVDLNGDYFQFQDLTDKIFNYFRSNNVCKSIISNNIFNNRYNNNNDIFIHIRLTDAERYNPGLKYYINCIENIKDYNNLYISSDDINHYIIKYIYYNYKNVSIINYDIIETLQFGSTCKNIILSHGSFSAVIGWLAFYSNVYYLDKDPNWCPIDMFKNKNWIGVNINM